MQRHPNLQTILSVTLICILACSPALMRPAKADPPRSVQPAKGDPCDHMPTPPGQAKGIEKNCPAKASSSGIAKGDFNGDGFADLAIGIPSYAVVGTAGAGAVNVIYGSNNGLSAATLAPQFLSQIDAGLQLEGAANFGTALAAGDFNGDGYSDLAVVVPHQFLLSGPFGPILGGRVVVFYGSKSGLAKPVQIFDPCDGNSPGGLVWGDFDGDKVSDLLVGCPGDSNHSLTELFGGLLGLDLSNMVHLNPVMPSPFRGTIGVVLTGGDFNGDGITDVALGIPDADLLDTSNSFACLFGCPVKMANVGVVITMYGSPVTGLHTDGNQYWYQGANGICCSLGANARFGASLAAGDFNGGGKTDLAIGIPGASVGGVPGAGAVVIIYGSATGLNPGSTDIWNENSIGSLAQPGNAFATALAAGDFNGDGYSDLAIGIPFEPGASVNASGQVDVIYGAQSVGLSLTIGHAPQFLNQGQLAGSPQVGAHLGSSLSAWNFGRNELGGSLGSITIHVMTDLAIGIPGYTVSGVAGAGAIDVVYGSHAANNGLLPSGSQLFTQASLGFTVTANHFGSTCIERFEALRLAYNRSQCRPINGARSKKNR